MGSDASSAAATAVIHLIAVSVSQTTGNHLVVAAAAQDSVAVWLPHYEVFDPNTLALWLLAVVTFACASLWAGQDFLQESRLSTAMQQDAVRQYSPPPEPVPDAQLWLLWRLRGPAAGAAHQSAAGAPAQTAGAAP